MDTRLPENRTELRKRIAAGEVFEFYMFYGHRPSDAGVDASCLSQWFVRAFQIDDICYPTAEHWMMAEKARLFGDDAMLKEILASDGPREAKAFGRKVQGFDNEVWGQHKYEIVKRGNYQKFTQHDDLKDFLISTAESSETQEKTMLLAAEDKAPYQTDSEQSSEDIEVPDHVLEELYAYKIDNPDQTAASSNVILVEAAGRDTIWGIGLGVNNPKSQDPFQWRGLNLLGFALTAVRDQIIATE